MAFIVPEFTEPVNEDGSCSHLKDNKCTIYENRPEICRVDKLYEQQNELDKLAYYKKSNEFCNQMIKESGIDDKYLIDIDKAY